MIHERANEGIRRRAQARILMAGGTSADALFYEPTQSGICMERFREGELQGRILPAYQLSSNPAQALDRVKYSDSPRNL